MYIAVKFSFWLPSRMPPSPQRAHSRHERLNLDRFIEGTHSKRLRTQGPKRVHARSNLFKNNQPTNNPQTPIAGTHTTSYSKMIDPIADIYFQYLLLWNFNFFGGQHKPTTRPQQSRHTSFRSNRFFFYRLLACVLLKGMDVCCGYAVGFQHF